MNMGRFMQGKTFSGFAVAIIIALAIPDPVYATQLAVIDEFKTLDRDTSADKIVQGGHVQLDNAVVQGGNLQVVKGRDRLNDTAHVDTTVSGFFYYENSAGTTKKFIVKETDELVTYDTDGTNRTQITAALTDEAVDFVQIGDNVYINSSTDGLHKWTGSGSATAITGVSAPSSVDFSAASTVGAMTSGQDALLTSRIERRVVPVGDSHITQTGSCIEAGAYTETRENTNADDKIEAACSSDGGATCSSITNTQGQCMAAGDDIDDFFCLCAWIKDCATTTTYKYKLTKYNNTIGIESEASTADSATLEGADIASSFKTDVVTEYSTATNCTGTSNSTRFQSIDILIKESDRETSTSGTLASAPSGPFNVFRIYRTVAIGSDFFLLGEQDTGAYTDGKADVSLGPPLDTTIDTIDPPSFRYIEEYKGVLFTAEGTIIRFQRGSVDLTTDFDKYWLEPDLLPTGAIKRITGLHNAGDSFLVFTENKVLELTGFGLESFRLRTLLQGIGAINDETIETDTNGDVIFFSGVQGVYRLTVGQQQTDDLTGTVIARGAQVVRLSSPIMDIVFAGNDSQIDLDPADYSASHAYYDLDNDFYWLFIDEDAFIFDSVNQVWSHIPGFKASASVYRRSSNAAGQGVLLDDLGYFWNNWTGYENSTESGTVTGNPTSATNTTLTDTGATFDTTLDGLTGVWVIADCSDTLQYRRISSNTATVLTIDTAWDSNPTTACTYFVGYIIFDILTKEYSFAQVPKESMNQAFTVVHTQSPVTQDVDSSLFINKSTSRTGDKITKDFASTDDPQVSKFGHKGRGNWMQYGLRSFIFNTSDTIVTPIDIISYAIRGIAFEED